MPSPFPGMNPYLERGDVWHDFHEAFLPLTRTMIVPQVRPAFIVQLDQHVYIHELNAERNALLGRSDVHVVNDRQSVPSTPSLAVLEAPAKARVPLAADFEKQAFIEIRDREDRSLVAVLELLSPINKKLGPDRNQFLNKRREILASSVNYVEIDLLRGGPRLPVEDMPQCDYYVMVSRWERRPEVGIWPLRLADPLPTIPIPLRAPYPDAQLDLQSVLNRIYDEAGYEDYIYRHTPEPKLRPKDKAWARHFVPKTSA